MMLQFNINNKIVDVPDLDEKFAPIEIEWRKRIYVALALLQATQEAHAGEEGFQLDNVFHEELGSLFFCMILEFLGQMSGENYPSAVKMLFIANEINHVVVKEIVGIEGLDG